MANSYWLHRISHEGEAAYVLLDEGYLTIGWSDKSDTGVLEHLDDDQFEQIMADYGRGKWALRYFGKMEPGDLVVVPQFGKQFSIVRVVEKARPLVAREFPGKAFGPGGRWAVTEAGLVDTAAGQRVDLGFACKVELLQSLERGAADTPLRSRMKIRQTTAKLQDDAIIQNIESLLSHPEGRNFAQALQDSLKESLRETIDKKLDDRQFEYLVKWYMEKLGAQAEIPSKNSSEKPDGADADVIATFDKLNVALYIQVKKHDIGTLSDEEAVDQVLRYTLEIENNDENVTYIPWAITFADDFSETAKKKAQQAFEDHHIALRLISREEFLQMLLDVGIQDIGTFLE